MLKISNDLALPADAVTQTFAILAKRGVGKTYTASVMVEELLKAALQVVVADPVGVWWGLRAAANGKDEGMEIIVMGGEHGDVPLEVAGGELVADFVVDSGRSVVLDFSSFRKGEQMRFMTDFAERLYHRNRAPLQLVVDEADAFAPQRPQPGEARMLGAMEDLVRRGRARGIGVTLITQRPAVLNKNVLTQIEVLICLRMIAPQDRAAIDAWIQIHGSTEQREQLMTSLPSLPVGTAWFWSPGWLDLFQQVKVRRRETFDSSSTPKVGDKAVLPRKLKPVDLDELRVKMASTIEQKKANDPAELRREIARLEKELITVRASAAKKAPEAKPAPALKPGQLERLGKLHLALVANLSKMEELQRKGAEIAVTLQKALSETREVIKPPAENMKVEYAFSKRITADEVVKPPPRQLRPSSAGESRSAAAGNSGELSISPAQQRILDALAWWNSIGESSPSTLQVGAIALIDASGGHFGNVVGPISSAGLVTRGNGVISLTEEGAKFARVPRSVGTLDDYHNVLRERVLKSRSASAKTVEMLNVIIAGGGREVTTEEIGQAVGIDHTGGHFGNKIGPLGTLGLVERSRGVVRPTQLLFPPGL